MKEYRVKKKLRLWMYILASLVIIIYGGMTIVILIFPNLIPEDPNDPNPKWLPLLFLVMIGIMVLAIITIKKSKIIITDKAITSIGLFGKRELSFNEIKGFNVAKNPQFPRLEHITIEPTDKSKKCILFTNMIEDSSNIKSFLNAKFTDSDLEKKQAFEKIIQDEKEEILVNEDFGFSVKEREEKLKKARLISKILIGAGVVVTVWTIFFPNPYKYAVIACITLPIITLLVIKYWKGLIRVEGAKNSTYPNASFAIIMPGNALLLRVCLDFSIDDYSNIWIPAITIAITLTGIKIILSRHLSFKKGKDLFDIFGFILFSFIYGYSAVVSTNCTFDKSKPQLFYTAIDHKKINGGKYRSYDLYLSPWGIKTEIQKVSIDEDLYNQLHEGDEAAVYVFKGKFNVPWLVVGQAR
jgi:hypothetical protein